MSDGARPPMSISEQADFIDYLVGRTVTRTGATAAETTMFLSADEVESLNAVASRLRRMAPHEAAIKRVVVGR